VVPQHFLLLGGKGKEKKYLSQRKRPLCRKITSERTEEIRGLWKKVEKSFRAKRNTLGAQEMNRTLGG